MTALTAEWRDRVSTRSAAIGASFSRFLWSVPGAAWLFSVFASAAPSHLEPGLDPDASWRLTLNLVHGDGARFGREVVYTYGPWGFLDDPNAVSRSAVAAGMVFAALAVSLTWWGFWRLLRERLGAAAAAIITSGVLTVVAAPLGASNLLLAGIVTLLAQYLCAAPGTQHAWVPAGAAAAGAFLIQVKLSVGAFVVVAAFLAAVLGPARPGRRVAESALAAVGTFLAAWLLAGQELTDLATWLSRSVEVIGGYSEAMGTDPASPLPAYGWAITAVVLTGVALWRDAGGEPRGRIGLLVLAALSAYYGYRQGFGRFDYVHQPVFYIAVLPFAVRVVATRPRSVVRWAVLGLVVVLGRNQVHTFSPGGTADRWETAVRVVVDDGYRDHLVAEAKAAALIEAELSEAVRVRLRDAPVSVDGYSTGLAWMDGRPLVAPPVFQSYVAYTAALDDLNVDWLRRTPTGSLLLRPVVTAIDGRNTLWDPPRYVLDELCRTRVVVSDPRWLLLRTDADRCGPPVDLAEVHVHAGSSVPVPTAGPGQMVVMSFRADDRALIEKLLGAVQANIPPLHVTVDGRRYRLPAALAEGPLLTGIPATFGWPASHGGGTAYRTVSFDQGGTVTFRSVPIRARD